MNLLDGPSSEYATERLLVHAENRLIPRFERNLNEEREGLSHIRKIEAALDKRDDSATVSTCLEALKATPEELLPRVIAANLLHRFGRFEEGNALATDGLKYHPYASQLRVYLLTSYLEEGNTEQTLEHASKLLEAEPSNARATQLVGLDALYSGDLRRARILLFQCVEGSRSLVTWSGLLGLGGRFRDTELIKKLDAEFGELKLTRKFTRASFDQGFDILKRIAITSIQSREVSANDRNEIVTWVKNNASRLECALAFLVALGAGDRARLIQALLPNEERIRRQDKPSKVKKGTLQSAALDDTEDEIARFAARLVGMRHGGVNPFWDNAPRINLRPINALAYDVAKLPHTERARR